MLGKQKIEEDKEKVEVIDPETQQILEEEVDNVKELPEDLEEEADKMTSISQLKPSPSQISNMSGRTYISEL